MSTLPGLDVSEILHAATLRAASEPGSSFSRDSYQDADLRLRPEIAVVQTGMIGK